MPKPNSTRTYVLFKPDTAPEVLDTVYGKDTCGSSYVFSHYFNQWYAVNPGYKQWVNIGDHQVPPEYKLQLLLITGG